MVIIVSILLAFAIDAWWEAQRELDAEVVNLARVSAEISENSRRIDRKLQTVKRSIDSTSTFISWMGPDPIAVEAEVLLSQWDTLYGVGFFSLQHSATLDYLATGQLDSAETTEIRRAISDWYSQCSSLRDQYMRLRTAHAKISDYLQDAIPYLHLISPNSVMDSHPRSKFPLDQSALLGDPELESRLALYLIRLEFVSRWAARLRERQDELVELIDETIRKID
jgi:hypothetical protein